MSWPFRTSSISRTSSLVDSTNYDHIPFVKPKTCSRMKKLRKRPRQVQKLTWRKPRDPTEVSDSQVNFVRCLFYICFNVNYIEWSDTRISNCTKFVRGRSAYVGFDCELYRKIKRKIHSLSTSRKSTNYDCKEEILLTILKIREFNKTPDSKAIRVF